MTMMINKHKITAIAGFALLTMFFPSVAFGISDDKAELDIPFSLKLGETTNIDSVFEITFLNVTEDSRCPADAFCVWQGTASIKVNITNIEKISTEYILSLVDLNRTDSQIIDGHNFRFFNLEPYPLASIPTPPSEYIATIVVSKIDGKSPDSPIEQFREGVPINEIVCKENLVVVIKSSTFTPACVKQKTAEKLITRGWALDTSSIDSFEECEAAGNPVMESYPRQCKTSDGTNFVEEIDSKIMSPESLCNTFGGNWLEEFNECEGISNDQCTTMNGTFKECESACRHIPDAEVCTMQCVLVCIIP